jgi:thiol:disulfide interchange protein DsbC
MERTMIPIDEQMRLARSAGSRLAARVRGTLLSFAVVALVTVMLSGLGSSAAQAQRDPTQAIREAVEKWLKGRYPVDAIRRTPLDNLYEVQIGTDLIYVDQMARYAFIEGQMVDLQDNKNLTQARLEELLRIDFKKDLPLGLAIKQVNGSGKRVLAVFEDPNCTYCRKLRRDLVNVKDLTIYTFAFPILAPDSETKSRQALCAKDPATAWNELMISGKVPDNDGSCATAIDKLSELGRKLKVTGTPTIFFANGKRVPGAMSIQQLEQALRENSTGGPG